MVPALVAAALASINWVLVLLWLPESLTAERRAAIQKQQRPAFSFSALLEALRRPYVGELLHTRFFFGLAFATFQTIFALYAQYRFGLNSTSVGYILAYVGVLSVITQGFLIGRFTQRFNDTTLITGALGIMALSLLAWAFAPSVILLLVILIPTAVSGGLLNTVLNSATTKAVEPVEVGGILGLSASLESLTRVIAPSLGGLQLEKLGTWAPGVISSLLLVWLTWYVFRRICCMDRVVKEVPPQA